MKRFALPFGLAALALSMLISPGCSKRDSNIVVRKIYDSSAAVGSVPKGKLKVSVRSTSSSGQFVGGAIVHISLTQDSMLNAKYFTEGVTDNISGVATFNLNPHDYYVNADLYKADTMSGVASPNPIHVFSNGTSSTTVVIN